MSSSAASSLIYASQKVIIYLGIPILIVGVTGSLLNVIVFRSIKIFRQNSCIFYLTVMSIVNMGQLITGFLSQIMISGFNIDYTQSSTFYCKFRWYYVSVCALISSTCMCFATIDQFLATCSTPRWQRWSNIKVAYTVTTISTFIWLIYGIPNLIYNNLGISPTTGTLTCISANTQFYQYYIYSFILLFAGFLPIVINTSFGLLTYYNIQQSSQRTLPLIRRELDKQLTAIVLVQVIYYFIAIIPYIIVTLLIVDTIIMKDPLLQAKLQLASAATVCFYYLNFSIPFYMYICVSHRFRHQFINVFCKTHFKQRRRRRITVIN